MSQRHPRALITGVAGFVGSHLADLLLKHDQQVVGAEIEGASTHNLRGILDQIDLYRADIRDIEQVRAVLADVQPDQVFHLAALNKPPAHGDGRTLYRVNVLGTLNLLEAVRTEGLNCTLLIAGSSAQYGLVPPDEVPIRETHRFCPVNHYALSKVIQDLLGHAYWASFGMRVLRCRTFNIIGPRQTPGFVGPDFARQVVRIERGLEKPIIHVGNLESQRDFVDVRDVARAYQLVMEKGQPDQSYNVCSGQARSIYSLLKGMLALSTVDGINVRQERARLQAADVPMQVGDCSRLHQQTGWQPEIPFRQSLHDLLEYWRGQT